MTTHKFKLWNCESLLSTSSSTLAVKHGPCLLTLTKWSRLLKLSAWGDFSTSPTSSITPRTGCVARSTSLLIHRNLFWQLSRDGNLHGSGMSHAMATFENHPSGHLWGWVMLWWAEEVLDGHNQRVKVPSHSRSAYKGLQKVGGGGGGGSLLSHPSCSPNYPISQGTELNWTDFTGNLHADRYELHQMQAIFMRSCIRNGVELSDLCTTMFWKVI